MTIKECIDNVDNIKPNEYSIEDKVKWLSFIDQIIINDVLKTHEGYDGRYDDFAGYSEDKLSETLIVQSPYDRLYAAFLKMKIDGENGETARYNNSASLFNSYMMEYRKFYNKTHMPLDITDARCPRVKPNGKKIGLSEEEFENLKRELYYLLSDDFAKMVSQDKLYGIVTNYVNNNIEMLRGLDGKDGAKGDKGDKGDKGVKGDKGDPFTYDDFTSAQLDELVSKVYAPIAEDFAGIEADVAGLQTQLNEEAHFRGYLSTNAKIQALDGTPNDFAYSAESGTKWVYDADLGWLDTGTLVPDQLTPASNITPLVDGVASAGQSNEYARGDHRHPTDTTRASVEDLNKKADKPKKVVFNDMGTLELADNTIYESEGELLNPYFNYPEGDFMCSITFTLANMEDFDVTVTLPQSKYIGGAPTFAKGETWELNIKNGVVVGGLVE